MPNEPTAKSADDGPFYMLNALWFRPDGGAETYQRYIEAVGPLIAEMGARIDGRAYAPQTALIGDFDADLIFFVEWPSTTAFQKMVQDERYAKIRHLREDAITRSLLVRCVEPPSREA